MLFPVCSGQWLSREDLMSCIHRCDEQRPCVSRIRHQCHAHHADDELPPTVRSKRPGRLPASDVVHVPCLRYLSGSAGPACRVLSTLSLRPESLFFGEELRRLIVVVVSLLIPID